MKTTLLQIPSKTTEEVNWFKPLHNYLVQVYGHAANEYSSDVTSFNQLRQDLRGAHPDATGIKLFLKYYSQLELLDLRIPFNSINTPTRTRVEFKWTDSFEPDISNSQGALAFEKANVLYNLASLLSRQASIKLSNGNFKEGMVASCQAAGVIDFIGENFLHAPSPDLALGTIKLLSQVMMSQAAELFVLQAISADAQQKMNQLVAKLCQGVAESYALALSLAQSGMGLHRDFDADEEDFLNQPEDVLPEVPALIEPRWRAVLDFKRGLYQSLAWYYQGLSAEANKKYGDAIAYLTKTQESLEQDLGSITEAAADQKITLPYEMLDYLHYQEDAVKIKLADLSKDNDLIYHDLIPSLVTLTSPVAKQSVEPVPFGQLPGLSDISDYNYHNFLSNVVPIKIHELLSLYSEEKSQLLRNEIDHVEVSDSEVASALSSLQLPQQLIALKELSSGSGSSSSPQFGDEVTRYANEIRAKYAEDKTNRQKIEQYRQQIYQAIQSLPPSDGATQLKRAFYQATTNDNEIFGYVTDTELHDTLGKGQLSRLSTQKPVEEELSLLDLDESNRPIDQILQSTEKILDEIEKAKRRKHDIVGALKTKIHDDDIADILVLNSRVKSTKEIKSVIFPEELKKFDEFTSEIDEIVETERGLVAKLKQTWAQIMANPEVKRLRQSSTFQAELVKSQSDRVVQFYHQWRKYSEGLRKGTQFYPRLLQWAEQLRAPSVSHTSQPASAPHQAPAPPASNARQPSHPQQTSPATPNSSLIYDQPSTYQPNMYQFFSKQ
ncbi:hypothetical protein DIURU_000645 [Diutina rugosa]|uniref:BRO domain-containing protein 1 n=1 Tax=Diutina rugosa TaxID=5481 RepID=A0A642UWU1_DIURU|nr:uncharacterized protein DIURU_000645 [Diutina rugosa]KAA8906961.1 hypothetical protein DIURU_000645 [Diutina rugosa]